KIQKNTYQPTCYSSDEERHKRIIELQEERRSIEKIEANSREEYQNKLQEELKLKLEQGNENTQDTHKDITAIKIPLTIKQKHDKRRAINAQIKIIQEGRIPKWANATEEEKRNTIKLLKADLQSLQSNKKEISDAKSSGGKESSRANKRNADGSFQPTAKAATTITEAPLNTDDVLNKLNIEYQLELEGVRVANVLPPKKSKNH
ncbi:MAG: hypothetical protein OEY79_01520, partial [Anaplasmataceae bacterium]|nr:hypothetical protein [Anaplasmataceae bacterium]